MVRGVRDLVAAGSVLLGLVAAGIAVGVAAEVTWSVREGLDPVSGKHRCLLESVQKEVDDGQTMTSMRIVYTGEPLHGGGRSTVVAPLITPLGGIVAVNPPSRFSSAISARMPWRARLSSVELSERNRSTATAPMYSLGHAPARIAHVPYAASSSA